MFVDKVHINVKAGNGGNGCASFHREKFVAKGGPNGGNGGAGGNVVFVASSNESTLVDLKYSPMVKSSDGVNGMGSDRHGQRGPDTIVHVPVGTIFRDIDRDYEVIADLSVEGQQFVACKGGRGGFGNRHFVSNINKLPRTCEGGKAGEERNLELELKIIADVGLVGFPNAGKSSLISAITKAHPKVAPYPFTTLHPVVGIIEYDDFNRVTIADIPGLIEGAHNNVGLGHDFLRHIERTKMLVYVLDMAGTDNRDPLDDLEKLKEELEFYKEGITEAPAVIVANKMDVPESAENLERLKEVVGDTPVYELSALEHTGIYDLTEFFHGFFEDHREDLQEISPTQFATGEVEVVLPEDDDDFWEF